VYQVGDQWVARSWPRQANQPNSAAQLLWRQNFTDAHALIKKFSGEYLKAWRAIECPPEKCWIDIAITSALQLPSYWVNQWWTAKTTHVLYYAPNYFPGTSIRYIYVIYFPVVVPPINPYWFQPVYGSTWQTTMKWNDLGLICSAGKRPKKLWAPSVISPIVYNLSGGGSYPPPGNRYYAYLQECPNGVTAVSVRRWLDPVSGEKKWSLVQPPIFCKPTLWPPWITP